MIFSPFLTFSPVPFIMIRVMVPVICCRKSSIPTFTFPSFSMKAQVCVLSKYKPLGVDILFSFHTGVRSISISGTFRFCFLIYLTSTNTIKPTMDNIIKLISHVLDIKDFLSFAANVVLETVRAAIFDFTSLLARTLYPFLFRYFCPSVIIQVRNATVLSSVGWVEEEA